MSRRHGSQTPTQDTTEKALHVGFAYCLMKVASDKTVRMTMSITIALLMLRVFMMIMVMMMMMMKPHGPSCVERGPGDLRLFVFRGVGGGGGLPFFRAFSVKPPTYEP